MTKHTSEMNNSNNSKQPEALHLADYLEFSHRHAEHSPEFIAAGELRHLYAEVDRLSYQLAYPDNFVKELCKKGPVGSLSVRYHRGCKSMTNTDFDYNGDLPEGDYELYTSPLALLQRCETEMRYAGWDKREVDNYAKNEVYEEVKSLLEKNT